MEQGNGIIDKMRGGAAEQDGDADMAEVRCVPRRRLAALGSRGRGPSQGDGRAWEYPREHTDRSRAEEVEGMAGERERGGEGEKKMAGRTTCEVFIVLYQ